MVALSNVTRTVTIRGESTGLDETAAKLRTIATSQGQVAVASETVSKSTLSMQNRLNALQRTLDAEYRSEQLMAKAERELSMFRAQGLITLERENELLGLARARYTEAGEAAKLMGERINTAKEFAMGLIGGLGAGAAFAGLAELPMKIMETVHEAAGLSHVAETIGITTDKLQELQYAGAQFHVSADTMDTALERFSKNLGMAATGSGELAKILKVNHVAISGDLTTDLENYANLIKGATNEEQRNLLVKAAFGKGAAEMGLLFSEGAAGIRDATAAARENGAVLSGDQLKAAQDLDAEFIKMQAQIGTTFKDFAITVAPLVVIALQSITDGVKSIKTAIDDLKTGNIGDAGLQSGQWALNLVPGSQALQIEIAQLRQQLAKSGGLSINWSGTPITVNGGRDSGSKDTDPHIANTKLPTTADPAIEAARRAYENLTRSARDYVEQENLVVTTYGMSAEAASKMTHEQDLLNKAAADHIKLTPQQREEISGLASDMAEAETRAKQYTQTMDALASTLASMFSKPITDANGFFDTVLGGFSSLGQANLKAGLQSLLSGNALAANDNASTGGVASDGSWVNLTTGLSRALDKLPDKVGDGVNNGFTKFLKDNASTIGAAAGGLGIGYQTQNPLMGALGGAVSGLATGDPIGVVVGAIGGLIGGIIGMNEALQKAKDTLAQNKSSIDQFIDTGLGKAIDADALAVAQFKEQGAQLVEVAKAAGDTKLVAQLNAAMKAYAGTLAASHVQDDVDQTRKDVIDAYHDQVTSLQGVIDQTRDFIDSMDQFRDSLKLDKSFSPLSPQAMLEEAQKQFDQILAKAKTGDVGAEGQLQGAATSYLGAAQGYLGSSDDYTQIFNKVEDALGSVEDAAQSGISGAEAQLAATNQSLTLLGDIGSNGLDQLAAINKLTDIAAAAAQLGTSQSAELLAQIADLSKALKNATLKKAS